MTQTKWLWYPGDFELYHAMLVHSRRQEGDYEWPAVWKVDDCWRNVIFQREVELQAPAFVRITGKGVGYWALDDEKRPLGTELTLAAGKHKLVAAMMRTDALPAIRVDTDTPALLEGWQADNLTGCWLPAGENELCDDTVDDPAVFPFVYSPIEPERAEVTEQGLLIDYGRETFARLAIRNHTGRAIRLRFGESLTEAVSPDCYYAVWLAADATAQCVEEKAFRYLLLEQAQPGQLEIRAEYQHLSAQRRGSFRCSDDMLNRIWDASAYTFALNSREFFLDGIKRDRWVWSGDAYQSYFVNDYLCFDQNIAKRTITALFGRAPFAGHINTIMDYSFFWLMSVERYHRVTGDDAFARAMYPKMLSMLDYCLSRLDENGLAVGREGDWVFIDWSELDKQGPICAEQVLLARGLRSVAYICAVLGLENAKYRCMADELTAKVQKLYWDEEKGAFIDGFVSGRRLVTRQTNLLTMLFDVATEAQKTSILANVLNNPAIPPITTPYFKFFEMDALCAAGKLDGVTDAIRGYWGGMLQGDGSTIWEAYDASKPLREQYDMYGRPFDKSLCHAWGASPVYLFGRYYLGVMPTAPKYATFTVEPELGGLDWIRGDVPAADGSVRVYATKTRVSALASRTGGTLIWHGIRKELPAGQEVVIEGEA